MDDVTLTDDEVVALGAIRGAAWPGGAPTVGTDAIGEAIFRGNRSLFVRGFKDGDAERELDALTAVVFDDATKVVVYLGDDALRVASRGFASVVHPAGDHVIIERVDVIGLHRMVRTSVADAQEYLEALFDGAFQAGPDGDGADAGEPRSLCATALAAGSGSIVIARRGSVEIGPATAGADGAPVTGELTTTDPASAAQALLALAGQTAAGTGSAPIGVVP